MSGLHERVLASSRLRIEVCVSSVHAVLVDGLCWFNLVLIVLACHRPGSPLSGSPLLTENSRLRACDFSKHFYQIVYSS